ncbi:MAG: hypothetical protein IMW89_19450 [Ktedonobacteraceae bacterium]|nr:hypothetical protein [Ktedonobacteraceae bacterium]
MRKKKKRQCQLKEAYQPQPGSTIYFTLPTITLLKKALDLTEEHLFREPGTFPNKAFAQQVIKELKTKLDDILQQEDWEKETPLDYNEVHMLYAAVHMYLVELSTSQQQALIASCIALCEQFSVIVEHADKALKKEKR